MQMLRKGDTMSGNNCCKRFIQLAKIIPTATGTFNLLRQVYGEDGWVT
jgi:hypothetical protein